MKWADPPADDAALLARARRLAGWTVAELAEALETTLPAEPTRHKGFLGNLVEAALGASAGSRSIPDFPVLGIELKTVPIDPHGRPKESTFVCTIPLNELATTDFEHSSLYGKLSRVLFVPIEAAPMPMAGRRLGAPILWQPSAAERALLAADWDLIAGLIGDGELERLTAHHGEALQVRPKGADARARRLGPGADGSLAWTMPRGFYLRARFTDGLLRRGLAADPD